MNTLDLFNELTELTKGYYSPIFIGKDVVSPFGTTFRIFQYLTNPPYDFWALPGALEGRGIMFEMDGDVPVRIASRPMEKFFNYGEPIVDVDIDEVGVSIILDKMDGSLISTYMDGSFLQFKSKGAIDSDVAMGANQFMFSVDQHEFRNRIKEITESGYTCNFEYTAPNNRIILEYTERRLTLLNIRDNETGEYIDHMELFKDPILRPYLVNVSRVSDDFNFDEWHESVMESINIEGYVIKLNNNTMIKVKCDWYVFMHDTKNLIQSDSDLVDIVTSGSADDFKSMFNDDESIKRITKFEQIYYDFLRESNNVIKEVISNQRGKDRQSFYEGAQSELVRRGHLNLINIVMWNYDSVMPHEELIDKISAIFTKYYKQYVS